MKTIEQAFDPRDNGITPVRLGLALLVVFSHSFVAGGFGYDPLYHVSGGQMQLGTVAVIAFFGLSGFLLARSRATAPLLAYVRNRALRILPGLWACLAVIALGFIPLAVASGGTASPEDVVRFVTNAASLQLVPVHIDGLFPGSAMPSVVNAPLWTLPPEALCYVGLGLVGAMSARLTPLLLTGILAIFVVANVSTGGQWLLLHLPVAFLVGTLLYHHRTRLPLSGTLAVALVVLTGASAIADALAVVAPLALPYVALWVGASQPVRWTRDLSYGAYIYAWPTQQLLAVIGVPMLGWLAYIALTVPLVLALAWTSAVVIEEPAMRLRHRPRTALKATVAAG